MVLMGRGGGGGGEGGRGGRGYDDNEVKAKEKTGRRIKGMEMWKEAEKEEKEDNGNRRRIWRRMMR